MTTGQSNKAMPEGFAELQEYLEKKPNKEYTAAEIQAAMRKNHDFSSGKVTGIIARACERKLIEKLGRSRYRLLNSSFLSVSSDAIALCKKEIQACISKIETISGQKISETSLEELLEIKTILEKLKELTA